MSPFLHRSYSWTTDCVLHGVCNMDGKYLGKTRTALLAEILLLGSPPAMLGQQDEREREGGRDRWGDRESEIKEILIKDTV